MCAAHVELVMGKLVVGELVGLLAFPGWKENSFVVAVLVVRMQRGLLF